MADVESEYEPLLLTVGGSGFGVAGGWRGVALCPVVVVVITEIISLQGAYS